MFGANLLVSSYEALSEVGLIIPKRSRKKAYQMGMSFVYTTDFYVLLNFLFEFVLSFHYVNYSSFLGSRSVVGINTTWKKYSLVEKDLNILPFHFTSSILCYSHNTIHYYIFDATAE